MSGPYTMDGFITRLERAASRLEDRKFAAERGYYPIPLRGVIKVNMDQEELADQFFTAGLTISLMGSRVDMDQSRANFGRLVNRTVAALVGHEDIRIELTTAEELGEDAMFTALEFDVPEVEGVLGKEAFYTRMAEVTEAAVADIVVYLGANSRTSGLWITCVDSPEPTFTDDDGIPWAELADEVPHFQEV